MASDRPACASESGRLPHTKSHTVAVVRCVQCRAAVSEWAARCPACGATLDGAAPIAEEPQPAPPAATGPPPIATDREPGHRRRSHWVLAVNLAIVAATAVVVGLVVGTNQKPSRPGTGAPASASGPSFDSYTVVYTGENGVEILPLDGQKPRFPVRTETGPPVGTSAGVAFVHDGTAYLISPPYEAPPRPVLAANGLFPMVWPGTIGAERGGEAGSRTALYVDLEQTGSTVSPEGQFPLGYQPVGQFFALGPGGLLRFWWPDSGGRVQLGPVVGHAAAVVGTVNSSVAWLSSGTCAPNGECTLHVTTSDTPAPGVDQLVRPPRGHAGFLPGGAVDPTGSLIAAFVATSPDHATLAIVDTGVLDTTLVPDSTIAVGHGTAKAQWTPDGAYVLFSGPGGSMHAYAPGAARAVNLGIKGSTSFTVG